MIDWIGLGVTDLVSVIPPDAKLSPGSKIAREARGKVPGVKGPDGWHGYPWREQGPVDEFDLSVLIGDGANIGVRGERWPAIDVDVDDERLAALVVKEVEREFGTRAARRHSKGTRALFMLRAQEPIPRKQLHIYDGVSKLGVVEFLGAGQQYVIEGRHPSGAEYRWEPAPDTQYMPSRLYASTVDEFYEKLAARLDLAGYDTKLSGSSSDAVRVPQEQLLAPSDEAAEELLKVYPNSYEHVVDRMDWITHCHAVCASFRDKARARDAWLEWCEQVPQEIDPEIEFEKAWKLEHRVGWQWLVDRAAPWGAATTAAQFEFEADADAAPAGAEPSKPKKRKWRVISADEIELKKANWLWHERIPRNMLTLLVGDGGVGKGLLWVWITSQVTNGNWGKAGNVLVLQKEATREYEIGPRLKAAGCDMGRVKLIPCDDWTFPESSVFLAEAIVDLKPDLVVFDPLASFVSKDIDSHVDASVRTGFSSMISVLDRGGAAGLATIHTNKRESSSATARINGSVAWRNLSRSCFVAGPAPDEDGIVLAQDKNQLRATQSSLRYRIETREVTMKNGETDRVAYMIEAGECDYDVAAVFAGGKRDPKGRAAGTDADDCAAWLIEKLRAAPGRVWVRELQEEAREAYGWSAGAWNNARKIARERADVKSNKDGLRGKWFFEPLDPPPSSDGLV